MPFGKNGLSSALDAPCQLSNTHTVQYETFFSLTGAVIPYVLMVFSFLLGVLRYPRGQIFRGNYDHVRKSLR